MSNLEEDITIALNCYWDLSRNVTLKPGYWQQYYALIIILVTTPNLGEDITLALVLLLGFQLQRHIVTRMLVTMSLLDQIFCCNIKPC